MDFVSALIAIALVAISTLLFVVKIGSGRDDPKGSKRPPEVSGWWPIIGHLHLLAVKVPPQRILGDMADKCGPIFYIRLGRKPTLVVSNWEMAKECLVVNDKVFLDRPSVAAINRAYGGAMFGLGPRFGQYWDNMRRISTHELLSNTRLDLLKTDRSSEVNACVKHLFSLCRVAPTKVDMSDWSSLVIMNIMTRMVVGTSFDPAGSDWHRFVKSMEEFMNLIGTFVISDVIPYTEWMDLQGHFKAVKLAIDECDGFITGWLEDHVRKRKQGKVNAGDQDFLDVMLTVLEKNPKLSHPHSTEVAIRSTVMNLIIGGFETTTTFTKWAFSLLANHPEVIKKVQAEIDDHVGKKRWIEESDMKNLMFLISVLKEAMRIYIPLGVPRMSVEDCTIAGYHIPKGTSLILNLWKMHHDPRVWSDPDKFQPERFMPDSTYSGEKEKNFMFMPFSAGRKSCPGPTAAMQMMFLSVGRVLQGFVLSTPDGNKVDMREGLGLTNPRATPLELVLTPRLAHELY